jgi:hypothetical protein
MVQVSAGARIAAWDSDAEIALAVALSLKNGEKRRARIPG